VLDREELLGLLDLMRSVQGRQRPVSQWAWPMRFQGPLVWAAVLLAAQRVSALVRQLLVRVPAKELPLVLLGVALQRGRLQVSARITEQLVADRRELLQEL
jgi:hypothetical protein